MKWDAQLYDHKRDYVAEYGKGLLEFIPNDPEQAILDLGCGTGALTAQLAKLGSRVIGIDSSPSVIYHSFFNVTNTNFCTCDEIA